MVAEWDFYTFIYSSIRDAHDFHIFKYFQLWIFKNQIVYAIMSYLFFSPVYSSMQCTTIPPERDSNAKQLLMHV